MAMCVCRQGEHASGGTVRGHPQEQGHCDAEQAPALNNAAPLQCHQGASAFRQCSTLLVCLAALSASELLL